MPDYDWTQYTENTFQNRYPGWAIGAEEWRIGPRQVEPGAHPLAWLPRLAARDEYGTPLGCPRIFVSHKQEDYRWALRIAWIAKQEGFDFWLDVINLRGPMALLLGSLPPEQMAIATAAVIEMGLLNCSHVIAAMTPNTRGSLWVPYEYGRVKDAPPASLQAGCWRHPDLDPKDFPEHLHLGAVNETEQKIAEWLQDQKRIWVSRHGKCHGGASDPWTRPVPPPLP